MRKRMSMIASVKMLWKLSNIMQIGHSTFCFFNLAVYTKCMLNWGKKKQRLRKVSIGTEWLHYKDVFIMFPMPSARQTLMGIKSI